MSAFLRLLAAFLVGGLAGAAAVLYLQPTFSIVVTNAPAAVTTLVDAHPPVVEEPEFVPPPAPVATSGAVAKGTTPSSPAPASVSPAPSPATAAPAPLDYAQVAARPTFWPAEVLAAVPSVITFTEDGKKTGEMKLATGAVLQLSGVQADGTLELRAQGRKFTLHAKFTDFDDLVRKKAQQLLARAAGGTAAETPAPAVPAPVVTVPAPVAPAKPRGPLTLQQKLDALYGRGAQEPAADSASPSVAPAPAPASPVVTPAPATSAPAAPSGSEKSSSETSAKEADLKQRMDSLFRPPVAPAR